LDETVVVMIIPNEKGATLYRGSIWAYIHVSLSRFKNPVAL